MTTIIWLAVIFLAGVALGSLTMGARNAKDMHRAIDWHVMHTLRWVERMHKMGRLQEALAEMYEMHDKMEEMSCR